MPDGYNLIPISDKDFDPAEIINELRKDMADTQSAWGCLFKKNCWRKADKEVLNACLSFLEKEKPELLESGFIYNCLIQNESYLPFVNDVKNFVTEKKARLRPGTYPDDFTVKYMIDRITKLNGLDRRKAIDRLNEVLAMAMEGKTCRIHPRLVKARLRLFSRYEESWKMDFYDDQGNKIPITGKDGKEKAQGVIGYLKTMLKNGYPLDSQVIASYLAISKEIPENPYSRLLEKIPEMSDVLENPVEHNRMILWQFKAGEISIETALEELDWTNVYVAISIFGEILNCYIESQPRTPDLFKKVRSFYNERITKKDIAPTSIALSVIAKATSHWEDMRWLLKEYDRQHKKNPWIALTPHFLTA